MKQNRNYGTQSNGIEFPLFEIIIALGLLISGLIFLIINIYKKRKELIKKDESK